MDRPSAPRRGSGRGERGSNHDMQVARTEPIRLTYHDLLNLPDDGRRHELIDGEHFVTPAPALRHQELLGRLHLALGNHLARHRAGKVHLAPVDVVFSSFDVVEPDLFFVSNERLDIFKGRFDDE